jgi:hypothetical protein
LLCAGSLLAFNRPVLSVTASSRLPAFARDSTAGAPGRG